jgi:hypothetical protein
MRTLCTDIERQLDSREENTVFSADGPVALAARAGIMAAAFSLVAVSLLEGVASWRAWSTAVPVRFSVIGLQSLPEVKWSFAPASDPELLVTRDDTQAPANFHNTRPLTSSSKSHRRILSETKASAVGSGLGFQGAGQVSSSIPKTRDLLWKLAVRHRESVLRLWDAPAAIDPVLLKRVQSLAQVKAVAPKSIQRSTPSVASSVLTDHVHTRAAAPMNTHRTPSLPRNEYSAPLKGLPGTSEPRLPLEGTSDVLRNVTPSVPHTVAQAKPEAARPQPSQSDRGPSGDSRVSRLTGGLSQGTSWLMLAGSGLPSVLYAQNNVSLPTTPGPLAASKQTPMAAKLDSQSGPDSVTTQGSSSQVSGWIPAGTWIKIKGASKIDYFSLTGELVGLETPGEKYFVSQGLSPGPAILQLFQTPSAEFVSAAGVPVLDHSQTRVDFRQLRTARVRGHVWNSESTTPDPIARAEVRLVGFPGFVAISAADGSFDLGTIQLPRGLTAFVEIRQAGGFTHRYSLSDETLKRELDLFVFSEQRVHRWIAGLEGGVSSRSGLIVASSRSRSRSLAGGRPVVKPIGPNAGLPSETYWLSGGDQLIAPNSPYDVQSEYFQWVAVEVTAPSVLAGLQSARGRWIEAQWVPTSPGVISVLTPAD